MIDWLAVIDALGLTGAASVWLLKRGGREARLDAAIKAEAVKLRAHTEGCEERYREIRASSDELRESMTASMTNLCERIETRLDKQDEVADQRNREAVAHRTSVASRLESIGTSVAILEENRRMRERWEDRG